MDKQEYVSQFVPLPLELYANKINKLDTQAQANLAAPGTALTEIDAALQAGSQTPEQAAYLKNYYHKQAQTIVDKYKSNPLDPQFITEISNLKNHFATNKYVQDVIHDRTVLDKQYEDLSKKKTAEDRWTRNSPIDRNTNKIMHTQQYIDQNGNIAFTSPHEYEYNEFGDYHKYELESYGKKNAKVNQIITGNLPLTKTGETENGSSIYKYTEPGTKQDVTLTDADLYQDGLSIANEYMSTVGTNKGGKIHLTQWDERGEWLGNEINSINNNPKVKEDYQQKLASLGDSTGVITAEKLLAMKINDEMAGRFTYTEHKATPGKVSYKFDGKGSGDKKDDKGIIPEKSEPSPGLNRVSNPLDIEIKNKKYGNIDDIIAGLNKGEAVPGFNMSNQEGVRSNGKPKFVTHIKDKEGSDFIREDYNKEQEYDKYADNLTNFVYNRAFSLTGKKDIKEALPLYKKFLEEGNDLFTNVNISESPDLSAIETKTINTDPFGYSFSKSADDVTGKTFAETGMGSKDKKHKKFDEVAGDITKYHTSNFGINPRGQLYITMMSDDGKDVVYAAPGEQFQGAASVERAMTMAMNGTPSTQIGHDVSTKYDLTSLDKLPHQVDRDGHDKPVKYYEHHYDETGNWVLERVFKWNPTTNHYDQKTTNTLRSDDITSRMQSLAVRYKELQSFMNEQYLKNKIGYKSKSAQENLYKSVDQSLDNE